MTLTSSTSRSDVRAVIVEGLTRPKRLRPPRSSASSVSVDPGEIATVADSAEWVIVEAQEPDDDRGEDVEDSGDAVAAVEGTAVTTALVLRDHLGEQASLFSQGARTGSPMAGMGGYTWYSEANFTKAHRWCLGMIAALKTRMPVKFFAEAIVDLYHFDRALRASARSRARHEPVRRTDIPYVLPTDNNYRLVVQPFEWSPTVPHQAIDTVAEFLQEITPDKFWIAEYEITPTTKYDPIIYATFGPWELELARWD